MNEYRARRLGLPRNSYISWNKISTVLDAPEYIWAEYGRGKPREATAAMLESKRIDLLLLEPERYRRDVQVLPFDDLFSKAAKDWKKETLAANPTALIINRKTAESDRELQDSVLSNPEIQKIFANIDWLRYGYATDPEYGLLYVEPDLRLRNTYKGMTGDIKAVVSIDRARFITQMEFFGWYSQLGYYGHGEELITQAPNRENKFIIGIEKFFPYRNKVFTLYGDYDQMANVIWRKGASKLAELRAQDPTFQDRSVWFKESHQIEELRPSFKHVNYSEHAEDFTGLNLGG